ncbi:MAG: hypothetical protein J1F04_01750 [Oscillospiraceae bacterium]|nr:hypothetical protein [Oscillospiraceae bacterium]
MQVEEELKEIILKRFKSVRAFAMAIGVPQSTINNIFTRGIGGVGISTAIPMCRALNIDVDALADGEIKSKDMVILLSSDEERLLNAYRGFNDEGKEKVLDTISDMIQLDRYKKGHEYKAVEKPTPVYRAARSQDNTEQHEIISDGKDLIDKLSRIPPVTKKEDI